MYTQQPAARDQNIVPNKEDTGMIEMHYKVGKLRFMLMVDPDCEGSLKKLRDGDTSIDPSTLMRGDLFVGKLGVRPSRQERHAAFGTEDIKECARQIMMNGEFHGFKNEQHGH
jgi:ribosome maturation protein Sdo1